MSDKSRETDQVGDAAADTSALDVALEKARAALANFLSDNPYSSVDLVEHQGQSFPAVCKPWGDSSIAFRIAENPDELFEALNGVILPKRFTGIWHKDKGCFEIIWTAYRLPEGTEDIASRKFCFEFRGLKIDCDFSRSSDALIKMAGNNVPLGMSLTQFRNLQSFDVYANGLNNRKRPVPSKLSIGEPISFWIRGIDWDEDFIVDLIKHLNFYMSYFDSFSPTIAIHDFPESKDIYESKVRYCAGKFPESIKSTKIDRVLLNFWEAAAAGDNARRFLYYYRIIEYSSHEYLEASTKSALRRVLAAPFAHDDVSYLVDRVLGVVSTTKLDEVGKFNALLRDAFDVETAWREISNNKNAFSQSIEFDGGYTLPAVCGANSDFDEFRPRGIEVISRSFRDIRNALSHGRDQKTSSVIAPTRANFSRLRPWVHLIAAAAGEVMLYKDAL